MRLLLMGWGSIYRGKIHIISETGEIIIHTVTD